MTGVRVANWVIIQLAKLAINIKSPRTRVCHCSSAFSHRLSDKKLQSCSCRQLQPFAFQHLKAWPSEYCMCEVSAARNVRKHVYTMVFVCRNRLNDQWVEVAGDLSALIRNLWSAKMFGLRGRGIGSCRAGRQAGWRQGGRAHSRESRDCRDTVEMLKIFTEGYWQWLFADYHR